MSAFRNLLFCRTTLPLPFFSSTVPELDRTSASFSRRGWVLSKFAISFLILFRSTFGSLCFRVDHPDEDEPPVRFEAFLYISISSTPSALELRSPWPTRGRLRA